jgi:uncharacterized phage protein (TIGR01671 family)
MREIKFRAWHKDERRWINLNGFDIFFNGCILEGMVDLIYEQGNLKPYPLKVCELVQYTGLKDKNGKEIYEGYIVEHQIGEGHEWSGYHEVIFYDGAFLLKGGNPRGMRYGEIFNWYPSNVKVIGNIYENPELLES